MKPGKIEVTGVPLEALVRAAYRPSRPQGLGFLHYEEGDLTDAEVAEIIGRGNDRHPIRMDYIKGRACKFDVAREEGRIFIDNKWYDHSTEQLKSLLSAVGLNPELVDQARKDETAHHEACLQKALAALKEHGGVLTMSLDDGLDDIETGLYQALDRGLVTRKYGDTGDIWSIKQDKAA